MSLRALALLSLLPVLPACAVAPAPEDASTPDVGALDGAAHDGAAPDATTDAAPGDASEPDAFGGQDADGRDAGSDDAGRETDGGDLDASRGDAYVAPTDAAPTPDASLGDAYVPPDSLTIPSTVSVAAGGVVTEGTGANATASVLLTVTPASPVDASVRIVTTPRSALSPDDYRFLQSDVSIPRGATSVMAPFEVVADGLDELDEVFEVMLIDPVGVAIGTATGTVTIADDDTADVRLVPGIVTGPEGNGSTGSLSFTVEREPSPVPTTIGLRLRSGVGPSAATLGVDFEPLLASSWTAPAGGAWLISFSVQLIGDTIGEPNETFIAEIFSVAGAELGTPSSLTLTIQNDDPPTIRGCDTSSVLESSGGRFTFRVTSAIPMTPGVSVGYGYAGTASVSSDYVRVSPTASVGAVPFPAGATELTFTIDVRDDVTSEPTETVLLTLMSVTGGATLDGTCTVSTLNIEDDD